MDDVDVNTDLPFRGTLAVAAGRLTRGRLRGPGYRRVGPDLFVTAAAPDDLTADVGAALMRYPDAVLVGTTAAVLWGAVELPDRDRPGLSGRDPVEIARTRGGRGGPDLRVRRDHLDPDEVVRPDGLPIATPARTAYDVGRRLATVDALVVIEALGRRHGVSVEDVREVAAWHPHARELARLRTALALVEPASVSALQSRIRLAIVAAGLRAPVVSCVLADASGAIVGSADLAWPEERCALMCGRDPATARQRAGRLVAAGWTVQQASPEQFLVTPGLVVENVGHMLRSSRRHLGLDVRAGLRWSRPRRRVDRVRVHPEPA